MPNQKDLYAKIETMQKNEKVRGRRRVPRGERMNRKDRGREGERKRRRAAQGLDGGQEERVVAPRVEGGR